MQGLHSSVRVQVWGRVPITGEERGRNVRPKGKNTSRACWGPKPTSRNWSDQLQVQNKKAQKRPGWLSPGRTAV